MSDFLKGNFKTKQTVTVQEKSAETLEDRFEREALRRLGGSIAFVSKRKVMWDVKATETIAHGTDANDATKDEAAVDEVTDDAQTSKVANGR